MTALIFCATGLYFFLPMKEETNVSRGVEGVSNLLICEKLKPGLKPGKGSIESGTVGSKMGCGASGMLVGEEGVE